MRDARRVGFWVAGSMVGDGATGVTGGGVGVRRGEGRGGDGCAGKRRADWSKRVILRPVFYPEVAVKQQSCLVQ